MNLCCGKFYSNLCFYAGYRSASHDAKAELKEAPPPDTGSKVNPRIDVRSRPLSSSRPNSRSRSNPRPSSRGNMYSSDGMASGAEKTEEVSLAQLQEMREMSKVLRDKVLSVQRTVQTKEGQLQRLRNERLPPDEVKQETEKLSRLRDRINTQEARLRKLRETKSRIQQQVLINTSMTAELDGLKNIVSNKEKEISEMDQLINQLNTRLQQAKMDRTSKNTKNGHYLSGIEKLKQEMLAHKRVTETVQGKFSSQREAVQSKKEEMNKVDLHISELWRKLQQAKAAQQQTTVKPATAIAAVGPFEHTPSTNHSSPESEHSAPTKPQEIDIKLVERNGGSGQSSPSVSADEREPYSMRVVKPVPLHPVVGTQSSTVTPSAPREGKPALVRLRSSDGSQVRNGSKPAQKEPQRGVPEDRPNRSDNAKSQLPVPSAFHSSSSDSNLQVHSKQSDRLRQPAVNGLSRESNLANHRGASPSRRGSSPSQRVDSPSQRVDSPSQRVDSPSLRVSSPSLRVSSPRTGSVGEMKMESGPVHQFKQLNHPKLTHSLSDPSITADKPKNFNTKPRPFGVASPSSPSTSPIVDKKPSIDQPANSPTSSAQSPDTTTNQSDRVIYRPTPISAQDDRKGREAGVPYSRAYPATPIMGRQQLNTTTSQSAPARQINTTASQSASTSSTNGNNSPQQQSAAAPGQNGDPSQAKARSPRYATRSQISDTYIQQVDKDKLEKYRRDMERAVRDISMSKQESTTPAPTQENTTLVAPQPSPSQPAAEVEVQKPENNDTSPPLTVLVPNPAAVASVPSSVHSSEGERPDHVIIYNPSETDGSQSHLKSIIKRGGGDKPDGVDLRTDNARFHPLVILLDTALNGTVDEVQQVLPRVPDPSASNDEGITALHNAICAGHLDIVQTLVEFGVDVNAVDTDGWTPLHCAASCNNQPVVEYLISRGACILATTYSDSETAREKCEMDEEGYDGTSKCLYNMEMKLGVDESVYCVYDYEPENTDELALRVNDKLTILRRGDKEEQEWWWAKCGDREGYVAKNLLAFTPRVVADKKEPLPE